MGGWHWVFLIAGVIRLAFLPLIARMMPGSEPKRELPLPGRDAIAVDAVPHTAAALESGVIGALVFASFSCFWTTLAFLLSSHYGLGAGYAGSFGLIGAAGALVAPAGGRMADRRGVRWVLTAGISILAFSYVLLWAGERANLPYAAHFAILVVGVIVLDIGAQLTQVGNQTRIFGLVPSARSRLNTVYMTVYFAGAAVGSALASRVWVRWNWDGVCALALGFVSLAGLRHALGSREGAKPRDTNEALGERVEIERVLEV